MTFPKLKLVDDWQWVLKHSWTIRFIAIAGILTAGETVLPLVIGFFPIPPMLYAALMFALTAAAFVARLVAQLIVEDK